MQSANFAKNRKKKVFKKKRHPIIAKDPMSVLTPTVAIKTALNADETNHWKRISILTLVLILFSVATLSLVKIPEVLGMMDTYIQDSQTTLGVRTRKATIPVAPVVKQPYIKIQNAGIAPPEFGSLAVIAQDFDSGEILFERNAYTQLAPASTTKIMTALVATEYYKPSDVLTVTGQSLVGGSTMGLSLGEQVSFRSLLYGMMLNSGNDAAYTIAANFPGGVSAFVQKMNDRVAQLGLQTTHFENPAGFDNPNHFSSAADLAQIGKESVLNAQLARIVATKETEVTARTESTVSAQIKSHQLRNLNRLLTEDGVIGIKTGTTDKAGESFVGLVEREGHKVITVVLNSPDRFTETKHLMDWVYANYDWVEVVE